MANINNIKDIVDTFYKIKKGITISELYKLCDASTLEEVDAKVDALIEDHSIKNVYGILKPFDSN
jgi:hypothetical protein